MFVYLLLMPIAGYFYTTPVFSFLLMVLLGNRKWLQMIVVSAAFTLMAYYVFYRFLLITLSV